MTDAEKNFVSIHNPSSGEVLHKFYYQFLSDKFIACPYFACVNEDDQLIVTDMRNNQIKVGYIIMNYMMLWPILANLRWPTSKNKIHK